MANTQRKASNNVYKKGKLSKNARFSPKRIKWTPIIIILCLLATFIFAMIFGNALGKKAANSQSTTPSENLDSNIVPPTADKVAPQDKLNAYFADMTGADPEKSLSEQTASARDRGNALLIELKNEAGEIIYSSDKAAELGFAHADNLTLSRLTNHFEYYRDFAVAHFKSNFSAELDKEKALLLQTNEILLLKEAADTAFGQIIIEFDSSINKDNLIYYQTYLLNLKLACPTTPIGIKLQRGFLNSSDNASSISGLLNIADFFVLDLKDSDANGIKDTLSPLIYFTERYDCVIIISDADEVTLAENIKVIEDKGIENYIVK